MKKDNLIELGHCGKPHGIKGGFSFYLHNVEDSILASGTQIFLTPSTKASKINSDGEVFEIATISLKGKVIAYLKGISDRNIVEAMVPFTIFVDRKSLPSLEDGELSLQDLIGFRIIEDSTGKERGNVKAFYDNGAQDIIVATEGEKEYDILFIDQFVVEVNQNEKEIRVVFPEILE